MHSHVVFKMLGDETRLRLIMLIRLRPICVCELEDILEMKQARISKQLMKLREEGMVTANKVGLRVFYALADDLKDDTVLMRYLADLKNQCTTLQKDYNTHMRYTNETDTSCFVCKG